jgi:uncharacterized membrane protein YqhA
MMVRGLEIRFGRLLFAARWVLAPLYAGMVLALIPIVVVFARELITELGRLGTLRSFPLLGDPSTTVDATRLRWMVVIQLTFVVSGVLLALVDWVSSRTADR